MKYRSRNDIVYQVLEAANGGAAKTKIMYKAYLSYAQLKEYLAVLDKNDLLEYDKIENLYRTTNKGLEYMKMYGQMGSLVESDQVIREYTRLSL